MEDARHVAQRAQRGRVQVVADADDWPHEWPDPLLGPPAGGGGGAAAACATARPLCSACPAICCLLIVAVGIVCSARCSLRLAPAAAALLLAALARPSGDDLEEGGNAAAPLGAACSKTAGDLLRVSAAAPDWHI